MARRMPTDGTNTQANSCFAQEVKHTFEWTLCHSIQDIVKSPVFVTKNNTKWYLKVDLRHVRWRKSRLGVHLVLDSCPVGRPAVDIRFNVCKVAVNDLRQTKELVTIFSKQSTLNPNDSLGEDVVFDDYFDNESNFTIYFEIIHVNSQPTIVDKVGNHLVRDLKAMADEKTFNDVVITVKGQDFAAHKCLLSARSQVFRAMFGSDMKESLESRVEINDIEVEVFEQLLQFIYTGSAPELDVFVEELLICGEFYGITDLKNICEEVLCQNITTESAIDLMSFAIKYNANTLKERLIDFIADNYLEIETKCPNSLCHLYKNESKIIETIVHKMAKLVKQI